MGFQLRKHPTISGPKGPLLLVVLDGVGEGRGDSSDAVAQARTPTLDRLKEVGLARSLFAHGTHVGLPSDGDMGNSEVGHNAMGCGRVYDQGALQVNNAIASGSLYEGAVWQQLMKRALAGGALHFLGLLSDGNVHSHIEHLFAMLRKAAAEGAKKLYVHALIDGRDVPSDSALTYVDALEAVLADLRSAGVDAAVASGGGRMVITMDRYEADWDMVKRGYDVHVHGEGRQFASAREAVETLRKEDSSADDQNLPPFVIARQGAPVARIADGDAVVCFNFRGDRAIEISRAFQEKDFQEFDRGNAPDVFYAGMMQYDGDTHVPEHFLVDPPCIERTMGEYMAENSISQLAISETQKYGHVTYFWNGNRSGKFDERSETYIEVPSDTLPFEERPWMKAAEITDRLVSELRTGNHRFARVNYANGDMVGHTGSAEATRVAVEAVDLCLARLVRAVDEMAGALIVTADHGNADEMFMRSKGGEILRGADGTPMPHTSHTLNPVPFVVYSPTQKLALHPDAKAAGIANVSASCFAMLGYVPPDDMLESLVQAQ